ncbi:MAG: S8 family peptidase [Cyanobacteria bacterium NC_groundwater_1444_Ag_S-0.65um_54_12]|nr:S8 family peptidase [Cyanobacteria bacterium NC_groundwater_1444_Ag_S-0.65um_54_12]
MLLKLDQTGDIDYLRSAFEFEVVAEQEDGFVIVATKEMNLDHFLGKIDGFIQAKHGTGGAASIHQLVDDEDQGKRLARILSPQILAEWPSIDDNADYLVEIGVECVGTASLSELKDRKDDESDEHWEARLARWEAKKQAYLAKLDEIKGQREDQLVAFVGAYDGQILSLIDRETKQFFDFPDSFTAKISMRGQGFRDLVLNFPHIFEVTEPEGISFPSTAVAEEIIGTNVSLLAPAEGSPKVCVIDSGIQEGHALLAPAILGNDSHSYVPGNSDVADRVQNGGHGTRVAGAILYPAGIPKAGTYQLPCLIQNARVLDSGCRLPRTLFPPVLLDRIIARYYQGSGTRIFNHSIAGWTPCRLKHMSAWAAAIDSLSYEFDVLFVQAAGNIPTIGAPPNRPGIWDHLAAGRSYPEYLLERSARIPNPAQSLQALTVGSVSHTSFNSGFVSSFCAGPLEPSAFSATGPGIWDAIKPDVVELGGDNAYDTGSPPSILTPSAICTELVRSTAAPPSPAFAADAVGTSYAAPKVSFIAAELERILPGEPALLYRGLIAQSARWPDWALALPIDQQASVFRHIGYGIPNLERATSNDEYRVTLLTSGSGQIRAREGHIFEVPIPEGIRNITSDTEILVEITLSYAARPRRTRRHIRGYLGVWVDWNVSKVGESPQAFSERVIYSAANGDRNDDAEGLFPWKIGFRSDSGQMNGMRRSTGTLQKDWAVVRSHQLTEGFCVAVVGHGGWDNDREAAAKYSLVVTFEALNRDVHIYEPIRSAVEVYQVRQRQEVEVEIETG